MMGLTLGPSPKGSGDVCDRVDNYRILYINVFIIG